MTLVEVLIIPADVIWDRFYRISHKW